MEKCCNNSNNGSIPEGELVCFCFKVSKETIRMAHKAGEAEKVLQSIKDQMKDPGCFCETANPKGVCCLADVKKFIDSLQ
ncbi:MAG: hypothetical protein KC493_08720 [Bacteriovoracaceae bacterium]|nr:hypothetical protein [Bacteriovoracaceae bacterium]